MQKVARREKTLKLRWQVLHVLETHPKTLTKGVQQRGEEA